eukprot:PITA_23992
MDFVGPINPPSKQRSYVIVCTDYLTKWAETKAIKAATEEKVVEFLRKNIFYKFGYPRELVTDQGSQFTSNVIEHLLAHKKIKHKTSTPYHPQTNGQVEVTNRALEEILTKVVSGNRKDWTNRLVEATWAYNTTWKTTTGTPDQLAHHGLIKLLVEDSLHTYTVPLPWETFRNMSTDDNIRILANELTLSSSEEGEHTEAGEKASGKETQDKQTQKGQKEERGKGQIAESKTVGGTTAQTPREKRL